MITRIEINGFKTFSRFAVDLTPFTAMVGPNASGKSNLFDAIKLLSELSKADVRSAMSGVRGEPEELFRATESGLVPEMTIAVDVLLSANGVDQFGTQYTLRAQRLHYTVTLSLRRNSDGRITGIYVANESCERIKKADERASFLKGISEIEYGNDRMPFLSTERGEAGPASFRIGQDGVGKRGVGKRGVPVRLPASEASRTALSTVTTAEFPHLYALREFLSHPRFLEINPHAARRENDRFQQTEMLPDAANLAAVLARIKAETATDDQPEGALGDISIDLARLIPSVQRVRSTTSSDEREYSYVLEMAEGLSFSSRVISDGTLRLLTLITVLNDPGRRGLLCFEEPENGIHEGRVATLIELIRDATEFPAPDYFQVLLNTHSPAVMAALKDDELVAADIVVTLGTGGPERRTRMRRGPVEQGDLIDAEKTLTRHEINRLLQRDADAA